MFSLRYSSFSFLEELPLNILARYFLYWMQSWLHPVEVHGKTLVTNRIAATGSLPGVPDAWNELLYTIILKRRTKMDQNVSLDSTITLNPG